MKFKIKEIKRSQKLKMKTKMKIGRKIKRMRMRTNLALVNAAMDANTKQVEYTDQKEKLKAKKDHKEQEHNKEIKT
jgi:hypothetical protein